MHGRWEVGEAEWELTGADPAASAPRRSPWSALHDTRAVLNGVLWVLGTGAQWRELPSNYPPFQTCHRRFPQWVRTGKLERALRRLAQHLHAEGRLDLREAFIDASFSSAKKGALPSGRPSVGRARVFPAFAVLLVAGVVGVRYAHMPVVRLEGAEQRLRKGDNTGALRELNQIVKARPNYAPAWLLLGNAYQRTQQKAQAEAAFQRAVQLNPKNAAALAQLGVLYLREQRYEQARQQFQQITELNPKDAEAQINLADLFCRASAGDAPNPASGFALNCA